MATRPATVTWACSPAREPCSPAGCLRGSDTATQEANLLLTYPNPNIHPCQRRILVQSFREESLCTWRSGAFPSPSLTRAPKRSQMHAAACIASSLLFDHHPTKHCSLKEMASHAFGHSSPAPLPTRALYSCYSSLPFSLGFLTPGSLEQGLWLSPLPVQHPTHQKSC